MEAILGFQEVDDIVKEAIGLQSQDVVASMHIGGDLPEGVEGCYGKGGMRYFARRIWKFWESEEDQATIFTKTIRAFVHGRK